MRKSKLKLDTEAAESESEYPNGFASLAAFIASDPDSTSAIFRRFQRLATRNLLHLQSRLQKLEADMDELDGQVLHTGDKDSRKAATSWEDLELLAQSRESEQTRMRMAQDIQKALQTYCEQNHGLTISRLSSGRRSSALVA